MPTPLKDGDRVVVYGKPAFYAGRGSFSCGLLEIRHVGVGDLLARIEMLRQQLAKEGLFDPSRKLPLPYLPHKVGLITGRGSAAERDVLAVAGRQVYRSIPRHQHRGAGCQYGAAGDRCSPDSRC